MIHLFSKYAAALCSLCPHKIHQRSTPYDMANELLDLYIAQSQHTEKLYAVGWYSVCRCTTPAFVHGNNKRLNHQYFCKPVSAAAYLLHIG